MGSLPIDLVGALRDELGLAQAVETGTHTGAGAMLLAQRFGAVTTIELSDDLHAAAVAGLGSVPGLTLLRGSSPEVLRTLDRAPGGALFWLDAHWSGHGTAGQDDPCPVLEEIGAIGAGHPDDCLLVDDARLFNGPDWPPLFEVMAAMRELRPGHHVTVVHDLIVGVPVRARHVVEAFSKRGEWATVRAAEEGRLGARRARLNRVLSQPALTPVVERLVRLRRRMR